MDGITSKTGYYSGQQDRVRGVELAVPGTVGRGFKGTGFLAGLFSRPHIEAMQQAYSQARVPGIITVKMDESGRPLANVPFIDANGIVQKTDASGRYMEYDASMLEEQARIKQQQDQHIASIIGYYMISDEDTARLLRLTTKQWLGLAKNHKSHSGWETAVGNCSRLGGEQKLRLKALVHQVTRYDCTIATIEQFKVDARLTTQATTKLVAIIKAIGWGGFFNSNVAVGSGDRTGDAPIGSYADPKHQEYYNPSDRPDPPIAAPAPPASGGSS